MDIFKLLTTELASEAQTTRKFLASVPMEKADWAPHEKSMKIQALATHIAELPGWIKLALTTKELDFASAPFEPVTVKSKDDLLALLEKSLTEANESLANAKEDKLNERWLLRTGETIHVDVTVYEMIRIAFSQTTHHRAQLGVYFRLLNIAVPASYGPTADDHTF
ncbi:MAG: DinB family protein [Bacteroidota bacterium]